MHWFNKVILEVNSDCNRKCHFCNRHGDSKNRFFDEDGNLVRRFMPMEFIDSIKHQLEELQWHGNVLFGHMSEPTLDPRIFEIVSMFKWGLGTPITFHTNGDVLKKDEELCRSLNKVVDRFVVGMYDMDGKPDQEVEQQKIWWKQRLAPANVIFSIASNADTRFQRRFSLEGPLEEKKQSFPNRGCTAQTGNLVIYYDGEVALCCEDINCDFGLGNVFEESLSDIWTSTHRLELVKKITDCRNNHPICATCPILP